MNRMISMFVFHKEYSALSPEYRGIMRLKLDKFFSEFDYNYDSIHSYVQSRKYHFVNTKRVTKMIDGKINDLYSSS